MKRFTFFYLLSICVFYNMHGMQIKDLTTKIEFNGVKKPILNWISKCLLYGEKGKKEPFSVTSIIKSENDKFMYQGDIFSLNENDIKEINNGNSVYCSFYTIKKTRLSADDYEKVGAIILGTKDVEQCKFLGFSALHKNITTYKKDNKKLAN